MDLIVRLGGPSYTGDMWTVKKLGINYGVFDDPVDENIDIMLAWWDVSTPTPDVRDMGKIAIWQKQLNYRLGAAGLGAMQTVFTDFPELTDRLSYEKTGRGKEILQIFASSSTAGTSLVCSGVLEFEQVLVQSQIPDDFSEYEFDFLLEDDTNDEHENQ